MAWEPTALVEALDDSVAVFTRDATFVYANAATERMFGRTRSELIGKRIWDLFPEARDSDFQRAFQRVQALGHAEVADAFYVPFDRWYRNQFYVIGEHIHVITRDITEHKLGERRLLALARASAVFTRALEVDQLFDEIARCLTDLVGDACIVRILEGTTLRLVALHHADAARRQALAEFFAKPLEATEGLSAKVLATGEPLLIERIDNGALRSSFQDDDHRSRIDRGGAQSVIAVALSEGAQRVGIITMLRDVTARPYARSDLSLLQDLTERASVALTRARLFEQSEIDRRRAMVVASASRSFAAAERDTRAVLDLLVRAAVAEVGDVSVASLVTDDNHLEPIVDHAVSELDPEIKAMLALRTPIAGTFSERIITTGKALRVADIDVEAFAQSALPHLQQIVRKFAPKAFMLLPIKRGDRVIGTLSVSRQHGDGYTDADQHLLQELADRAALAIENARVLEAERSARQHAERVAEQTRRLQAIGSHLSHRRSARAVAETILTESTAVLGSSTGAIWLLDETGTRAEMLADVGYTDAQRTKFATLPVTAEIPLCAAITTASPLFITSLADYTERFPTSAKRLGNEAPSDFATACLPLIAEGRPIGGLAFSYLAAHEFRADERAFLGVLANQCAQAIDRSRLLEQERAASAAHAESNRTLNAVIQASPAAIVIADLDGVIRLWNPAAEQMFGWSADEAIGRGWPGIDAGLRGEYEANLARLARSESITGLETKRARRDGTMIEVALWAAPVQRPDGATQALKVFVDITDRKRAEDQARAADRKKDEFLAMLGHELRNPLAPILTALELMRFRGETAGQRERDMIERQTRHLVRLVDDLLDISRITRGKVELRKARADIGAVIAQAVEMASPLLEQRGHHVSIAAPRGSLFVDGDSFRLAQVFQNLLTNAAKYTPSGGSISVRANISGDQIECEFQDNGEGISQDALATIFEPFVQGARALDRSQGGLGLGLTLVRSLTELHGGTVEAHSAGPGQGSRFVVRLPRAIEATRADKLSSDRMPALQHRKRRILLVDDNRDAAEMLADLLREAGHEVVVAYDGPGALGAVPQFQPDVALLDIGLPLMDGYDLARRLKALLPAAPRLVAISGYGQDHDRRRSAEAGFDAHLVKPVQAAQVLAAVDDKLRSS